MARTNLNILTSTRAGVNQPWQAIAAADDAMFENDGETLLLIYNLSGVTANIVFVTPATVLSEGLAVADAVATVPNAESHIFGRFPTAYFNQPSGADSGRVYVNTDQLVNMAAIRLGSST